MSWWCLLLGYGRKNKRQREREREWTLDRVKRLRKLHQISGWWRQMTKNIKYKQQTALQTSVHTAQVAALSCAVSLKRRPHISCIKFTVKRLEYNYSSHSKQTMREKKRANTLNRFLFMHFSHHLILSLLLPVLCWRTKKSSTNIFFFQKHQMEVLLIQIVAHLS